jgi:hypothetical protein
MWSLRTVPPRSQYATPNGSGPAGRETWTSDPRMNASKNAVAIGLHAHGRVVKPFDTTTNRTSSRANGDWAGTARSNPAESREFFQNPPPPDGPRRPPAAGRPPFGVAALGNGSLAGGGTPSPARSPDTGRPHAIATNAAPLADSPRYSTAREDEGEKTASRTPSRDRSAYDSDRGLAVAAKNHHAEPRPRELLLPKGKSRGGAIHSAPGRPSLLTPTGHPLGPA